MINIAVPELRRYAPDTLRMIGIPPGQADETADMLAWTEAVDGGAIAFIRTHRARLLWDPRPRVRVVAESEDEVIIDGRGGSLLEFGIRITDFLCAEAHRAGQRQVRAVNVYGAVFVHYLTAYAAQRNVHLVARWQDDSGAVGPDSGAERARQLILTGSLAPADTNTTASPFDLPEYLAVVDRGIELGEQDFETVTQLFEMLRVPTSERSRSHAG